MGPSPIDRYTFIDRTLIGLLVQIEHVPSSLDIECYDRGVFLSGVHPTGRLLEGLWCVYPRALRDEIRRYRLFQEYDKMEVRLSFEDFQLDL